ncbi:MAG: aminopeptidase [Lachnospiraceae bacterium]|nr:aminopeptidase [Lachnospiraceae bacterium]
MDYRERYLEENEAVEERLALSFSRIREIKENTGLTGGAAAYFAAMAAFVGQIEDLVSLVRDHQPEAYSLRELQHLQAVLYGDILAENYGNSPANPAKAVEWFGKKIGQRMAFVAVELRGMIAYAYEYRLKDIVICCELFLELYSWFLMVESGEMPRESLEKEVKDSVYYYVSDYSDYKSGMRVRELIDPSLSFARDIVMESDLSDLRYLYAYGEYVGENELKTAMYLNSLPEETICAMASTYTEGYRKGFELAGIDLSQKTSVDVRFCLGFERVVREAIRQFEAMGLQTILYRSPVHGADKRQHLKTGYYGAIANPQYEYDHRNDVALFLDKPYKDRRLAMLKVAYEECRELAAGYAGPAVMETFGEEPFSYENKPECCVLSEKQQKLYVAFYSESSAMVQQYIDPEKRSFTIISYPVPEIGPDFEEIFAETIRLNNLDCEQYKAIQQALIDALDAGVAVEIKGAGENRTELRVALQPITDPKKQTGFENCLADVNIPLGEVFTSPQLVGTTGMLHVSDIYLNDVRYLDLWLKFEDGFVVDYGCANDDDPETGRKLIKDALLYQHESLPLGEFAIGTNTTAYAMARKYGIISRLKILIIEKMGPHFAIGDTCYSHAEERAVFNPDGKEVIARENSCSLKRHEDYSKAYFNCHTDITIPYHELDSIRVIHADGSEVPLIEGGRFVLPGTEELNRALDEVK